jgi:DNA-binding transcriptional MerR regulator
MIKTYTVVELEELSGLTRRTIGDYVAKGLLSGPSHRGRGARYSQVDVDVLRIIPRLRTLMKKEFSSLRALRVFLGQLSSHEIGSLARKTNEAAFVLAVRTLRIRISMAKMLPQVAPERINAALDHLTPEQIRSVDTGRSYLGAVIDISALLTDSNLEPAGISGITPYEADAAAGSASGDIATVKSSINAAASQPSWSVNWLAGGPVEQGTDAVEIEPGESKATAQASWRNQSHSPRSVEEFRQDSASERLTDIARRLERLERLLVAG